MYTGIRAFNPATNDDENPAFNMIRVNDFPSMAVDKGNGPQRGRIYVVYAAKENGNGKAVIQIRSSNNSGTTWTGAQTISITNGRQNWFPWIAVDNVTGNVYVVYYSLDETTGFNTNTYVAISTDGGASFNNQKVSDVNHVTARINEFLGGYSGDYIGITAHNGTAYASWTDNRNGQWQVYVSPLQVYTVSGSDIVCSSGTTITLSGTPSPASWTATPSNFFVTSSGSGFSAFLQAAPTSGSGSISFFVTNAQCSFSKSFWVGVPTQPGSVSGNTTPSIGSIYQYTASYGSTNAANYDWLLPYNGDPVWSVSGGSNTLTLNAMVGSSSGNVQVFGQNVCGNSGASRLRVFPQVGPCTTCPRIAQVNKSDADIDTTFAKIALYPNPANTEFKVRLPAPAEQEGQLSLIDLSGNVKSHGIIQKGTQWITIGTSDIFSGIYFIKVHDGVKQYYRKVLVQH